MVDDVLLNKTASIERCVLRVRQEYSADPQTFKTNVSRQDAAILNLLRACEAALDIGQHLIRRERLGLPQSARHVFDLLAEGRWIAADLAERMKRMVGFRNIAVHEYQKLQLPIVVHIIESRLDDLLEFTRALLLEDSRRHGGP